MSEFCLKVEYQQGYCLVLRPAIFLIYKRLILQFNVGLLLVQAERPLQYIIWKCLTNMSPQATTTASPPPRPPRRSPWPRPPASPPPTSCPRPPRRRTAAWSHWSPPPATPPPPPPGRPRRPASTSSTLSYDCFTSHQTPIHCPKHACVFLFTESSQDEF